MIEEIIKFIELKNKYIFTTKKSEDKLICLITLKGALSIISDTKNILLQPGYVFFLNENSTIINSSKESYSLFVILQYYENKYYDIRFKKLINDMIVETKKNRFIYRINLDLFFSMKNKLLSIYNQKQDEKIVLLNIESIFIDLYMSVIIDKNTKGIFYSGFLSGAPWWLVKACKTLETQKNYKNVHKLLSDLTGKSQEHVIRQMRKYYGMTPSQYINEIRLLKAKKILTETILPIYDISFQLGFENPSYFSKIFKQKYGITPSKYRYGCLK
jgi:AraC-like DNA-binding protein